MTNDLRVLCIEDSEDDVILLRRNLKKEGYDPLIKQITNAEEMREALSIENWDVVICDYLMPDFDVESALDILQMNNLDIPFIIVSGTISDEAAVAMMKLGAHDYLTKDNLSRLVPAIRREIDEAKIRQMQRDSEDALQESEQRHRMLVDSMGDTVFVLDKDCKVSEYYSSFGFGEIKDPEKMVGKHIDEIVPGTNAALFENIVARVLADGKLMLIDSFIHIDGIQKWFSASLNLHEDKEHVVVAARDISDIKAAEEEIRAAHRMATLYLDIMGHDIRNYLQAMLISSDLLLDSSRSVREQELLERISDSIKRCEDIISNVQATGDLLSSPRKSMCLCKSVKETVHEFEKENELVKVNLQCDIPKAPISANEHIHTLIMNLLTNASKHNLEENNRIWVEVREADGGYDVLVSDNGPGIPNTKKTELFNPERRFGGVGIHQSKQITEKYGGCISVQDRIDGNSSEGACFKIWLPRQKPQ
ncbi:MAG: response regulator [Candidatus Thorarchaeota archaeon]|nr:response regulator [Candidatus Thorarchaeota archaeon]